MSYLNIASYKFISLTPEFLKTLKIDLTAKASAHDLKGTILLSTEGVNLFLAGVSTGIQAFIQEIKQVAEFADLWFKFSESDYVPFKRLIVRIKKEIISMYQPQIKPEQKSAPYLEPAQLKQWFDENKEMILLDTRNYYEYTVGTFKEAVHLNIEHFSDFPHSSKQLAKNFKEKSIVTFCTGGIRCEKAAAYLLEQGFKNVWQLKGGILNYFEVCKDQHFSGNCFVFDERIAVNANLRPVTIDPAIYAE